MDDCTSGPGRPSVDPLLKRDDINFAYGLFDGGHELILGPQECCQHAWAGRSVHKDPSGSQVDGSEALVTDAVNWKLNNAIDSKRRVLPNRVDRSTENPGLYRLLDVIDVVSGDAKD